MGYICKMTDEQYFKCHELSNSGMGQLLVSPFAYWSYSHMNPEGQAWKEELDTPAKIFGRALHMAILEPDNFPEYYRYSELNKNSKAFKELAAENPHVTWLTEKQVKEIDGMVKMLDSHQLQIGDKAIPTRTLFTGGQAEQGMFWQKDGVDLRAKADFITTGMIVDYKTTQNASMHKWKQSLYNFGYHRQAAMYLDAAKEVMETEHNNFIYVVQEKTYPFDIAVYTISDEDIEVGKAEMQRAIDIYKDCMEK